MVVSAGIIVYRIGKGNEIEVLLGHPGGPFFFRKDKGAWTFPKGRVEEGEDSRTAAVREFFEETGWNVAGQIELLGEIQLRKGKKVIAYFVQGDTDLESLESNDFQMEYPQGSGKMTSFPELDKFGWFGLSDAERKIHKKFIPFLQLLKERVV